MENKHLLEMEELQVSFFTPAGEVKAVNGISYTLDNGRVLGIVGESGSGKSVSVNALMRILQYPGRVTGGKIYFDGKDVGEQSNRDMRNIRGKDIAMIFQDPMTSLNPVYTIGHQLNEVLKLHMDISGSKANKRSIDMLKMVGINNPERRMKQYPHELSGGMRQRVMIAMALCCEPKLLIADEPTTALDVTIQAQILDLIKHMKERTDASVILITHDLGIISDLCDEVIVMYAGRIVERGDIDDIFYRTAHPYTQGLLLCLPRLDSDDKDPLIPIEGQPVDLIALPPGCAFASRCEHAMKICLREQPPVVEMGEGHISACWKCYIEQQKKQEEEEK